MSKKKKKKKKSIQSHRWAPSASKAGASLPPLSPPNTNWHSSDPPRPQVQHIFRSTNIYPPYPAPSLTRVPPSSGSFVNLSTLTAKHNILHTALYGTTPKPLSLSLSISRSTGLVDFDLWFRGSDRNLLLL
jgi:hypothetical protein